MKRMKGSLTIEAALIFPIILFVFILAIQTGITMYTECRDTAIAIKGETDLEIVDTFYRFKKAGELTEYGDTLY